MKQDNIWDFFQNNTEIDRFDESRPRYEFLAKKISRSKKVLNVGVGKGGFEDILVSKGIDVYCLDPSVKSIEAIRLRHGLGEKAKVGYSQDMPFDAASFDVVVMTEVLEHLDEHVVQRTLDEVVRVLKPNGLLIGTVPANEKLTDNVVACPDCKKVFHRWGHVQAFSPEDMSNLLTSRGFLDCQVETRAFPNWKRKGTLNFVKSLARYVLGRAGLSVAHPNIFFSARQA